MSDGTLLPAGKEFIEYALLLHIFPTDLIRSMKENRAAIFKTIVNAIPKLIALRNHPNAEMDLTPQLADAIRVFSERPDLEMTKAGVNDALRQTDMLTGRLDVSDGTVAMMRFIVKYGKMSRKFPNVLADILHQVDPSGQANFGFDDVADKSMASLLREVAGVEVKDGAEFGRAALAKYKAKKSGDSSGGTLGGGTSGFQPSKNLRGSRVDNTYAGQPGVRGIASHQIVATMHADWGVPLRDRPGYSEEWACR